MDGSQRSIRSSDSRYGADRIPVRSGAKALLTEAGRALLVEERHADGSAFWTLPGGGLAPGETPREGLRRELAEELNCRLSFGDEVARFWYVHCSDDHTVTRYSVFASPGSADVTPSPDEGILDAGWFRPSDCPTTTLPQVRYVLDDQVGKSLGPGSGHSRSGPARGKPGVPGRSNP